jgi:hypothetical protein
MFQVPWIESWNVSFLVSFGFLSLSFLVSFELFSVSSKVQWTMSDQKDSRTNQKAKVFDEKRSCYENGDEWRGKRKLEKKKFPLTVKEPFPDESCRGNLEVISH